MSAFNVAVVIPSGGSPTIEHSVAIAMEPYRGDEWSWYAIGAYDWPQVHAVILDGEWREDLEPDWETQYGLRPEQIVMVRCKDSACSFPDPPSCGPPKWKPTRWWRVVLADGSLLCETSSEREARHEVPAGATVQRLFEKQWYQWRDAPEGG